MTNFSEALGEDLNKSNFRASIERLGFANFQSPILGNRVRVRDINLCTNPSQVHEKSDLENFESIDRGTPTPVTSKDDNIETARKIAKIETIPRLIKIGLTAEQIAQALDLPLEEVKGNM